MIGYETMCIMWFALKEADHSNGDNQPEASQDERNIEKNKSNDAKSKQIFIYTFSFLQFI